MKYLRSMTLGSKDIGIRQSEFVTNTQSLCISFHTHHGVFKDFDFETF